MNATAGTSKRDVLHIDARRTYYALSQEQLDRLAKGRASTWKDLFLAAAGVALPTMVNGIAITEGSAVNLGVGMLTTGVAVAFLAVWRATSSDTEKLLKEIRSADAVELSFGTTTVGALPVPPPETGQSG